MGYSEDGGRELARKISVVEGMQSIYKRRGVDNYIEAQRCNHKIDGHTVMFLTFDRTDEKLMTEICIDADKNSVVLQISANPMDNLGYKDVRAWLEQFSFDGLRIMTRRPCVAEKVSVDVE